MRRGRRSEKEREGARRGVKRSGEVGGRKEREESMFMFMFSIAKYFTLKYDTFAL